MVNEVYNSFNSKTKNQTNKRECIMSKQVLSIEQMQLLRELGIDTSKSSMCWLTFNGDTTLVLHDEHCYESSSLHQIPAFTLQDILDILPKKIYRDGCTWFAYLYIDFENDRIAYGNTDRDGFEIYHEEVVSCELIDAAYNMLVWVIENGYIKMEETK